MPLKTLGGHTEWAEQRLRSRRVRSEHPPRLHRHTARDFLEVIDYDRRAHIATLPGFPAVAGAVADDGDNWGAATILARRQDLRHQERFPIRDQTEQPSQAQALSDRRQYRRCTHGPVLKRASMVIDAAINGQGIALARTALAAWESTGGWLWHSRNRCRYRRHIGSFVQGDRVTAEDCDFSRLAARGGVERPAPARIAHRDLEEEAAVITKPSYPLLCVDARCDLKPKNSATRQCWRAALTRPEQKGPYFCSIVQSPTKEKGYDY